MNILSKDIIVMIEQMEDLQILHELTDEAIYAVATAETKRETFIKMYRELKRIKDGKA